jgi:DNA-binding CsgD family transcriptional regulator
MRVLRAAPAEVETSLPYLVLVDLFVDVLPHARGLPAHLREALEVALLRIPGGTKPRDGLTVRIAVLELLRRISADAPVLLIIDDIQWADEASADVLAFAARRLGEAPVTMLAAERVAEGDPIAARLCPGPVEALPVEPLGYTGIASLLAEKPGRALPTTLVRRILTASGGNPLFAVELGKALERCGTVLADHEPLPVPDRLRTLLAERLAELDSATRWTLLLAAAMARPTTGALSRCGALPEDGLDAAERAQIVVVAAGGAVTFCHPLLREIVYADATAGQRRAAHASVATVVDDPVERTRHFALGSPAPDEATAVLADTAAAHAANRGALGSAAALARLAAERTPPTDTSSTAARLLDAARYADTAGHVAEARESATAALALGGTASVRVAARLLLIDLAGQDLTGVGAQLAAAEEDAAGEVALEAQIALYRATLAYFERRHADADADAQRAEKLAHLAEDVDLVIRALGMQATMALTLGRADADELHASAYRLADGRPVNAATIEARQSWAMTALFRGDAKTAFDEITRLEADVRDRGLVRDLMSVLISSAAICVRTGSGAAGLRAGRECARLFVDAGCSPGVGLVVAAAAEWCAGTVEAAHDLAARAIAACEAIGDHEWLEVACAVQGQALLLAGDSTAAVAVFARAAELEAAARSGDPAIIPWHADHIEALVAAGQLDAASGRFMEVRQRVTRFKRPVIRLGLERSCALHRAAKGDPAGAAEALRAAIEQYAGHSYPLDIARAVLTLGQLERRARRRAAARAAFVEAAERFVAIEADAWLTVARGELDRLENGVRPRAGALSETERRIVDLVRSGATNREISAAMYLSVKAVEAHLSRLYRRFGVRNRTDLLRALA